MAVHKVVMELKKLSLEQQIKEFNHYKLVISSAQIWNLYSGDGGKKFLKDFRDNESQRKTRFNKSERGNIGK